MPRANRYFIPRYTWHITHRCHKKEFLLKFSKDRNRWIYWLFQSKKRYGLSVLNYMVTSNHIHLLVADDPKGKRDVIPNSIKLIAGRTAQEFNQRKNRWSRSIAVGSEHFIKETQQFLGARALKRKIKHKADAFTIQEDQAVYSVPNNDFENTILWQN